MRRFLPILAIVLTALIAGLALAGKAEIIPGTRTKNVHVPGIILAEKTDILCGREYFETAEKAIREAKESICVAMYIVNVWCPGAIQKVPPYEFPAA